MSSTSCPGASTGAVRSVELVALTNVPLRDIHGRPFAVANRRHISRLLPVFAWAALVQCGGRSNLRGGSDGGELDAGKDAVGGGRGGVGGIGGMGGVGGGMAGMGGGGSGGFGGS